jgi:hypothetical protein
MNLGFARPFERSQYIELIGRFAETTCATTRLRLLAADSL